MEKILLKGLFAACTAVIPFVFKSRYFKELLIVFFAKGTLSTVLDLFYIRRKRIEYPVRPFPKIFQTNILFDLLFFPLLSVIWVRQSYKDGIGGILLKSLTWSVPMSIIQWYMEKKTKLFTWKKWNIFYTFSCTSFTLLTIRALLAGVKKIESLKE
ncbi:hypothetical protein CEF21_09220 [Bacillus sp. FJAT-42376]|uniref:CBO0543 family protein n=1 Tax=Bacillus sp. FJAT-42376 TaxID=2014076 RepID=UPI000F50F754|nr:CBO0543 family protein [Bacillus sp. FJAT-42376]AZB42455.1 hypothetical protein CEF21_09220 [Bacillus sp. FJAT-42376]